MNKINILKSLFAGAFISLATQLSIIVQLNMPFLGICKLLSGLVFSFGLILIVLTQTELFTGSVLKIQDVFEKRANLFVFLKYISLIYLGNIIGSFFVVLLLHTSDLLMPSIIRDVLFSKISLNWHECLSRGFLCNWLVCLAVYLSKNQKDTINKILVIMIPIILFVSCGYEHCIANLFYFISGTIYQICSFKEVFFNLLFVTIGNILGGIVCVVLPSLKGGINVSK